MKKLRSLLYVLVLVLLVACGQGVQESDLPIQAFLEKRAALYTQQEALVPLLTQEKEGSVQALEDLKAYMTSEALDRLLANRELLDPIFFQDSIQKAEVRNLNYDQGDWYDDGGFYTVTYDLVLTINGEERVLEKKEVLSFKKVDGSWKIVNIEKGE